MFENHEWCEQAVTVSSSASLINKVYGIMTVGLFVTALTAYYTAMNVMPDTIASLYLPAVIFEFVLVLALSFLATRMSGTVAFMCFLVYAVVNGFTLSTLLYAYSTTAIAKAFAVTGGTFGVMCLFGTVTRRDLSRLGGILFMALIGIVIASLVNIFFRSTALDFALSILGVLIFTGLTAYDAQKIRRMAEYGVTGGGIAVLGALTLYLDFINLFLYILRLFGRRK